MARQSAEMRFLHVAEQVFDAGAFQKIEEELKGLGQSLRPLVYPMFQMVIRTAALQEKPGVGNRQREFQRALNRLIDAGLGVDSILSLIRETRTQAMAV